MTFELPLFPLNVVLFPGMQLPLHIFEPRYRLMMRRCLEADRTFGVAMLVEGQEGQPGTVPADVGCSAEILEVAPFADGRMNIQSIGRRRFHVLSRREEDEYLIGTCEWLDDEASGPGTTEQAERLFPLLRRYLQDFTRNINMPHFDTDNIDIPGDPYALSMWLAGLMPLPLDQKQILLEMNSTAERLDLEYSLLTRAEIVQRAYLRRMESGTARAGSDEGTGPLSQFVSLN